MPDHEPASFSAMTSQQPSGRPTRARSTSGRQSISSLAAARNQHKPREEERKEEEDEQDDNGDDNGHLPPTSVAASSSASVSSSPYAVVLSSVSASLRSRHSAVQARLRSLSADHLQCKQQLLSALASYVSQAQRQLTAKQQQLIGHIHTLDTLDHTLSQPSLSHHQQQQLEHDVHDLLAAVEQLPADTQPPFDPFQVAATQQLMDDNRRMAAELEETKRMHEQDKAELQLELDRLVAQHEQMQSVIEQLSTAAQQQQQPQPTVTAAQQPHTTDDWKYGEEDTMARLMDKQRQLDTLTHEHNALKRQKQQSEQTNRDAQVAWNKAKQEMDRERKEWAEERQRRAEEEHRAEETRVAEAKRWQKERDERDDERKRATEREQHRDRARQQERQDDVQREQQRQDERRQEERAARQREVEKERDAIDKQRLQDELDRTLAALNTAERERREWMREKREWRDEKDREEAEREEREAERDRDRQRLLERDAAALTELRREKLRMEEDVKGEADRRLLAFVRAHKQRVVEALQHIAALMQRAADDGAQPTVSPIETAESDYAGSAIAAFDTAVDRLLALTDRYTAWITEKREDDKRRADEALLATQEKMGDRLTQLIRTHAAEAQDRQNQQQEQQLDRDRRAEQDERNRQQQAAEQQQQRQREVEQWKREREEERTEWDAERRRLEHDRREEVRAAILSCHREWRAKEDELRRQHQQRLDGVLQQAKDDTDRRIEQQQREVQQQLTERQQHWDDGRTELLTTHQQATQQHNQQLSHLQHQLHTLTLHTQQADERQSLALTALQRVADDEVRRVRREAVEGHDRIAAALIESRAEVGRLLKGREREKVDVELMRRQVSEWQADRRQWQEEKAAMQHEAERRLKEAERLWRDHVDEQRAEWERGRRTERETWKAEEAVKRRKEQQQWEQRLQQRETELSQQLTQELDQRVRGAQHEAAQYKQQADKEAQRYCEQMEADARRRQQRLQEERQVIEREAQEERQRLQREKDEIEWRARDRVAAAQSAASAAVVAVTHAAEASRRKSSALTSSSLSLTATPTAAVSQQSAEPSALQGITPVPIAPVDQVYDDGDSSEDEDENDVHETTLLETDRDALVLVPSSDQVSSLSFSSSSRLSAARSASLSILASLPPSTFASSLLNRLSSQSDPPPVPPAVAVSATVVAPISSPRLSTAALYWRSRPSSISEHPSSSPIGALDVSGISEQTSGGDGAMLDISSTTATRATTPSTSLLPSPEPNSRTIGSSKRYTMPPQHNVTRKGKQAESRERAHTTSATRY